MYGMSQGSGGYGGCTNCSSGGNCYSGSRDGLEYIASGSGDYQGALSPSSGVFAYEVNIGLGRSEGSYGGSGLVAQLIGYERREADGSYEKQAIAYEFARAEKNYHFMPEEFLAPGREGGFVGGAEEVRELVEEAFAKIFDCPFPSDVKVSVLGEKEFRKISASPNVLGLSVNRKKQGWLSEIFVLESSLGRVMLTIGHELGHVLTETLKDKRDEEAKAYAFSLEWMKVLKENNIGGLSRGIVLDRPAENGVHNVAFGFVEKLVKGGRKAWEVYAGMVKGLFSVESS